MKSIKSTLIVTALATTFVLCSGSLSWGAVYTKGRHSCDLEDAERAYKAEPKSVNMEVLNAACRILRAQGNDANEGMYRLYNIVERTGHIFAAFIIAEYIETGGRFTLPIDVDKIDEAISAYGRVLSFINHDTKYPNTVPISYKFTEEANQMELRAYYHVPMLYINKFVFGFLGLHNEHLLTSPGYNGDRNLNTHPKYRVYTQDSLDRVIQEANTCLALERKPHFNPKRYEYNRKACRIFKEKATALQPLEEKRLVLLATESCKRDLPNCREYNELYQQMRNLMIQKSSERRALSKAYQIPLF